MAERDLDREAAIIINDLDSLVHRIEMLQAHPSYTDALVSIQSAKKDMEAGRSDLQWPQSHERRANPDAERLVPRQVSPRLCYCREPPIGGPLYCGENCPRPA